jgi:hypothetical protein
VGGDQSIFFKLINHHSNSNSTNANHLLEVDGMTNKWLYTLTILVAGLAGGWALTELLAQETTTAASPSQPVADANPTTVETPLESLDWLVGSWAGKTEKGAVEFSCKFTKNNAFLVRSFRILNESDVTMSGMQVVAWDPVKEAIRSWTFDSDGGFGEDTWNQAGDRYTMRSAYTLADGGTGSAINVMTYVDDDTFQWKSTNREIDGELQPDTDEVVISRVADSVSEEANPGSGGGTN